MPKKAIKIIDEPVDETAEKTDKKTNKAKEKTINESNEYISKALSKKTTTKKETAKKTVAKKTVKKTSDKKVTKTKGKGDKGENVEDNEEGENNDEENNDEENNEDEKDDNNDEKDENNNDEKSNTTNKSKTANKPNKRGLWEQEEINKAKQLFMDGLTLAAVAKQLNRTEQSIKLKMYKLFGEEANGDVKAICAKYHLNEEDLMPFVKKPNQIDVLIEIRDLLKTLIDVTKKK